MSRVKTVTVEVDVEWDDISDDDLTEEMEARGLLAADEVVEANDAFKAKAERAYLALTEQVPDAVRRFVADCAGRIW